MPSDDEKASSKQPVLDLSATTATASASRTEYGEKIFMERFSAIRSFKQLTQ